MKKNAIALFKLNKEEIYYLIPPRLRCIDLKKNSALYIAFINSCLGNSREAWKFLEQSEPSSERFDSWSHGYCLLYFGATYKNLKQTKNAFLMYKKAIFFA
ncbi:hypothetical protein DSM107003_18140 [Trichormus variabilis SAG 1403-4b]|uniref:Tetratricopeptide repeat protein n=1 Tax=Trichormus variabilis SAG 1403-4b TaxID=447716 RepID=A0A433UVU7_ANAVA|nr:hypothetical protein DSM107003_18140 [Trichormus variabilis SAG 1403-4b]